VRGVGALLFVRMATKKDQSSLEKRVCRLLGGERTNLSVGRDKGNAIL